MKFTIKTLSLYKDLWYTTENTEQTIQTEYLWKYRCGNKNDELEPKKELYLLDGSYMGKHIKDAPENTTPQHHVIKNGKYLFLQGLLINNDDKNYDLFAQASEELYLESLWLDRKILNDIVYVRFLEEDGKKVFQLFREVEST